MGIRATLVAVLVAAGSLQSQAPAPTRQALFDDLVIANRILAKEDVVDAYGHVSVRHPDDPSRYLLSRSRAPEYRVRIVFRSAIATS